MLATFVSVPQSERPNVFIEVNGIGVGVGRHGMGWKIWSGAELVEAWDLKLAKDGLGGGMGQDNYH